MMVLRYPPWRAGWTMSIVASLFMTLIPWLGHGVHGYAGESKHDIMILRGGSRSTCRTRMCETSSPPSGNKPASPSSAILVPRHA